jgi:cbb3-type cytochrome oxidase cytochrome c subunit
MKSTWSLIVAAGAIVAVLFFVSSRGKKAPYIPVDQIHHTVTIQEGCTACHAPGKQSPLKDTHPPKEQCFTCHKTGKR